MDKETIVALWVLIIGAELAGWSWVIWEAVKLVR